MNMKRPHLFYLLKKKTIERFLINLEVYYDDNFKLDVSTFTSSYFLTKESLLETAVAYVELINKGVQIPTRKRGVYRIPVGFQYYIKGKLAGAYGITPRIY